MYQIILGKICLFNPTAFFLATETFKAEYLMLH